jgi:hypothetical protein
MARDNSRMSSEGDGRRRYSSIICTTGLGMSGRAAYIAVSRAAGGVVPVDDFRSAVPAPAAEEFI